jgi:subtilisin-like proprotein convertase family protein
LVSSWSDWQLFEVDGRAPEVALDLDRTEAFPGALLRDTAYRVAGDVSDAGEIARVDVCVDDVCGQAGLRMTALGATEPVAYVDAPVTPRVIDDTAACGGGAIERAFTVAEDFIVADLSLGFTALHERRDDLRAWLSSPAGTTVEVLRGDDLEGTTPVHVDVLLNDAHPVSLHEAPGDDDPTAPWFDRRARPFSPLRAFVGERSAGTWTLTFCDSATGANGIYQRSQLVLEPRSGGGETGTWTLTAPSRAPLDYVTQTVAISAEDVVGNRISPALSFDVIVDNVPPVLTVTHVAATVVQTSTAEVLAGTVSDGGPLGAIYVAVESPSGDIELAPTTWSEGAWAFDMSAVFPGSYRLWATAVDLAGNEVTVGPFEVEVTMPWLQEDHEIYLPMIFKDHVSAPDLIVESLEVSDAAVRIVVKNIGTAAVTDAFWVDLYVNPDPLPSGVNQIWPDFAAEGLVWGVTSPVGIGEVVTLTQYAAFYWGDYSDVAWPLADGTPVYVQVDSAHAETDYGGVLEVHELTGGTYNNIASTVAVAGSLTANDADLPSPSVPLDEHLIERLPPRTEAR